MQTELKTFRLEHGLTQEEMTNILRKAKQDLTLHSYVNREKGRTKGKQSELERFRKVLEKWKSQS